MNFSEENARSVLPDKKHYKGITQEMLKGLCFNCDHRKTCTWKEDRKLFCEHFE